MNYKDTPICGEPVREVPMREILCGIEKKLMETNLSPTAIIENLISAPMPEEKGETPEVRCMQDQIYMIDALSDDVMGMAHRIRELLF